MKHAIAFAAIAAMATRHQVLPGGIAASGTGDYVVQGEFAGGSGSPQYWQELRSRRRMFLRERARVWWGMRRYSSKRMTEGMAMRVRWAWRVRPCSSSVLAMPLSTRTKARRAPQMLMGS